MGWGGAMRGAKVGCCDANAMRLSNNAAVRNELLHKRQKFGLQRSWRSWETQTLGQSTRARANYRGIAEIVRIREVGGEVELFEDVPDTRTSTHSRRDKVTRLFLMVAGEWGFVALPLNWIRLFNSLSICIIRFLNIRTSGVIIHWGWCSTLIWGWADVADTPLDG